MYGVMDKTAKLVNRRCMHSAMHKWDCNMQPVLALNEAAFTIPLLHNDMPSQHRLTDSWLVLAIFDHWQRKNG